MRIYLPVRPAEIGDVMVPARGEAAIRLDPRRAFAVTESLRAAYPDEDREGLEFIALYSAADGALSLLATDPQGTQLRAVLTVEVPDQAVRPAGVDVATLEPAAVEIVEPVDRGVVVCVHVDEPEAASDVQDTITGSDSAASRLIERDLLWYDTSEFAQIPLQ